MAQPSRRILGGLGIRHDDGPARDHTGGYKGVRSD